LCRSDGVKPAHRRFAYKRVSPFILARPSVRRAAIAAADAELPLLSPLRVLDHSNTSPRPRRSSNPRLFLRCPPSLAGFRATAMAPPLPRRRCSPETSPPQCRPPATSWWAPGPIPLLPRPTPPPARQNSGRPRRPSPRGPHCKVCFVSRGLNAKQGHLCESWKSSRDLPAKVNLK
jgi:hypothetical protein